MNRAGVPPLETAEDAARIDPTGLGGRPGGRRRGPSHRAAVLRVAGRPASAPRAPEWEPDDASRTAHDLHGRMGRPGGLQRAAVPGAQAGPLVDDLHRDPRADLRHREPLHRGADARGTPARDADLGRQRGRAEDARRSRRRSKEVEPRRSRTSEPVIKDAEISDHVETDNDLPFEESLGEDGISDAPFKGPANNGLIGLGGGAGGAFGGRGGHRDLTHRRRRQADRGRGRGRPEVARRPPVARTAAGRRRASTSWCDGKPVRGRRARTAPARRSTTPA